MPECPNPKLQNILFTVKKNSDQNFELLYVSSEIRQVLQEGEKFFEESFFERIFPTLPQPVFGYLFDILGKGDKIKCPLILDEKVFQWVQIEGYVISQEDNSYLINVLVSPYPLGQNVKYSWIIEKSTEKVLSGKNSIQGIKNSKDLVEFISKRFKFLNKESLFTFLNNPEEGVFTIFPKHLLLLKEQLPHNVILVQLEFSFTDKVASRETSYFSEDYSGNLIYYDYDPATDKINWAGGLQKILGYSEQYFDSISKVEWESLIHPEDRHIYQKGLERSSIITYKILHKEGHYIFVQEERKYFQDGNTKKILFLGVIKDVSEIKVIEKALLENRSMLEQLTGVVPGMVYMCKILSDLTHQYIFVSEGSYQLTGLTPEEILRDEKGLARKVHPDDVEKLKQAEEDAYREDTKFQCYFRIITPEGNTKWLYGASNRLKQYEEESIWTGFFIDVTYTKEKEPESQVNVIKYKALFEENPLPILQFDHKGVVIDVNNRMVKEIGVGDREMFIGQKLFDLIGDHPIKTALLNCIEKGYGYYEGPYSSYFNKNLYHLRLTAKPIEDGKSFQAILEDISEQEYVHNVLSELAESTSKFSGNRFFEETTSFLSKKLGMDHCYIAEVDSKGSHAIIKSYSKHGKKQPTYSYELADSPCLESLKSNTPLFIYQNVAQRFANTGEINRDKISSYIGVPICDLEQNKIGLLVLMDSKPLMTGSALGSLFTVLADRIGAEMSRTYYENQLIASQQLFRSIAENFPKGTIDVLDRKLFYVYTEGKEYKSSGIDPTKLIGTPHLSKYESYVSNDVRAYLDKVLNGDSVMFEVINGDQYYLKSGVPLYNNAGEIDRILLFTQNITETKLAEEEREQLIRDLKAQNEELQRFAYIISHNLRAPIVNISSLLELYNPENPADPENEEIMDNLKMATDILTGTLQDLIEVVSIKKNRIPKIESIDFNLVCHNIERSLFKQIQKSGTVIHKDFTKAPRINYIYAHLENFLINLTTNAIKYKHLERNPIIHITTFPEGECTVIKFQDNGLGIDMERYGERLFGLYQRFHSHVDGKGLGLYLVREQIRAHHGNLKVNSTVNEGTTFYIYLKNLNSLSETHLRENM